MVTDDMTEHVPVLLHETMTLLDPREGETHVDGTLGGGGHASHICERIGRTGRLLACDKDAHAISVAEKRLSSCPCAKTFVNGSFRDIDIYCAREGVDAVDGILLDLGFSSMQIEDSGRGFSFLRDEALLMTLSDTVLEDTLTAHTIVNEWGEESIADIIYAYGEERYARRIAKGIVDAREKAPIETTADLVAIIKASVPRVYAKGAIHPATRTFQALRITVNDELGAIEEGIRKGLALLAPHGRMVVISFHSLEDRIVKRMFREAADTGEFELLTKKPIAPTDDERRNNPRARSAKVRGIQRINPSSA